MAGTRLPPRSSSHLEAGATPKQRAMGGGERGAGLGGDGIADVNDSRASREQHLQQRRPQSPSVATPLHENLACILPLYEWVSLGDGEIGGVETAIRNRSISGQFTETRCVVATELVTAEVVTAIPKTVVAGVTRSSSRFCCDGSPGLPHSCPYSDTHGHPVLPKAAMNGSPPRRVRTTYG